MQGWRTTRDNAGRAKCVIIVGGQDRAYGVKIALFCWNCPLANHYRNQAVGAFGYTSTDEPPRLHEPRHVSYRGWVKIVTWNCNGAFRRKYDRIAAIGADVYVIQECENPENSSSEYRDWAGRHVWSGKSGKKGLGVFVKNDLPLTNLNWPAYGFEQFLPVQLGAITLLAVWTKNSRDMGYIGQFWQYLQQHRALIDRSTIICGDFNSNAIWDRRGRVWNHSQCVKALTHQGLESVYHKHNMEEQGAETRPTFYMHRNLTKPYHIDYFFASPSVLGAAPILTVGDAADWLAISDHMPVTLTV